MWDVSSLGKNQSQSTVPGDCFRTRGPRPRASPTSIVASSTDDERGQPTSCSEVTDGRSVPIGFSGAATTFFSTSSWGSVVGSAVGSARRFSRIHSARSPIGFSETAAISSSTAASASTSPKP